MYIPKNKEEWIQRETAKHVLVTILIGIVLLVIALVAYFHSPLYEWDIARGAYDSKTMTNIIENNTTTSENAVKEYSDEEILERLSEMRDEIDNMIKFLETKQITR